jgi:hypothetical protein
MKQFVKMDLKAHGGEFKKWFDTEWNKETLYKCNPMHSLKASVAINRMQHIKLRLVLNRELSRLSIKGWRDVAQEIASTADGC